jgi:multidrug efflux pump subunit AcrB
MWIVQLALRRPYTFVVVALLIVVMGAVTIARMPTDIFPEVDIPVAAVVWSVSGLPAGEMEHRVTTVSERAITSTVNDIEHIESQTVAGVSVIKVFFHPGAKIEGAIAQLTAQAQSIVRVLPPGIVPPDILQFSATRVPILQLSVGGAGLPEEQLFDYAMNFVRTQLATIQGASVSLPYGGKPRQIMVDLDPAALRGKGLAATDVVNAIVTQNLILPSGTAKIGDREYSVRVNSSPDTAAALNDLPIRQTAGSVTYIRDVAHVRDGYAVQQNIVSENGGRSVLLTVLKGEGASTLAIVDRLKAFLPTVQRMLPPELELKFLFDQSVFVRGALKGVLKEGAIAALLTGTMILVFLGSWRSTLVVATSIPLAILTSVIVLGALGHSINLMTLGGLALAVGILVDDATVEIENVHRNLALGTPLRQAILDGARQIAVPAFVSTLAICIVFVPITFLRGIVAYLFTPLALAVVLAILASYLLSRTLVPTMVMYLLPAEVEAERGGAAPTRAPGPFARVHAAFERRFERLRAAYRDALAVCLGHRALVLVVFALFVAGSLTLGTFVGQDFFPPVDAGQIRLHVRAPAGTRIEETSRAFAEVEASIRRVVPVAETSLVIHNIGLPFGRTNLAYSDSSTLGPADGEILVALAPEHRPTAAHIKELRRRLHEEFPQLTTFFAPADIVSQILNFGSPSPIDIQVMGHDRAANEGLARRIAERLRRVPGAVDVHVHQVTTAPELRVNVDRTRAAQIGLSQRDVASTLLASLASSVDAAPNFWLNPHNGVSYRVAVQTPPYRIDSVDALQAEPLVGAGLAGPELLTNLASVERGTALAVANHYNVQPVFNVFASVQDRDLGGTARDIRRALGEFTPELPRGTSIVMRGQVESMNAAFAGLAGGLVFAVLLVYCLLVVNFQSWLDPFIIISALPGALAGILWALFLTQTTVNVPSLMGAIMSIGVATSNSILLVSFANDQRRAGHDAVAAALSAGFTRLRPVLMTALAMIAGMLPMALGLGEGGEQNAPLGRAVIGGLAVATFVTLFVVPVVYSVLRTRPPREDDDATDPAATAAAS